MPVCANGHAVFPPRLLCPVCGERAWADRVVGGATVEETTRVASPDVRLAAVRTDFGPRIIARLADGAATGDRVELFVEDGAPVARRSG
jgi:uncharacterized OB-fold protein